MWSVQAPPHPGKTCPDSTCEAVTHPLTHVHPPLTPTPSGAAPLEVRVDARRHYRGGHSRGVAIQQEELVRRARGPDEDGFPHEPSLRRHGTTGLLRSCVVEMSAVAFSMQRRFAATPAPAATVATCARTLTRRTNPSAAAVRFRLLILLLRRCVWLPGIPSGVLP